LDYEDGVEYKNVRDIQNRRITRCVLSGQDVLEETEVYGKYIPIVPVYGKEMWVNGKRNLHSLIRKAKDPQRLFNYWKSLETELLQQQLKAHTMAAEGVVDDYTEEWSDPDRAVVLRYSQTDIDGNPAPPPQRLPAPVLPTGIVNAAALVVDDIKSTMGIYNAALGQRSNETSGVAIAERKLEGDVATYHFADNLIKSITQVGRILVSSIPYIYDTARIIRIIGSEDEPKQVGINGAMVEDQKRDFNLKQGQYDVRVTTGASYTTKRQEAAQFFTDVIKSNPDLMMISGDLLFKYMDVPGAEALSERMKKVIDPKFLNDEDDPAAQQIQAMQSKIQEAEQVIVGLQQQLQSKDQSEQAKIQLDMMKINADTQEMTTDAQLKQAEIQLKYEELKLKAYELSIREQEAKAQILASLQQQAMPQDTPAMSQDVNQEENYYG
ncbi:MAG: portal protein, partial [Culicoidibacterales bacterium]